MPKCQQNTRTYSYVYSFCDKFLPLLQLHETRTHFYHFVGQERVRVYDIFPPPLKRNTRSGWKRLNLHKGCIPVTYHILHTSARISTNHCFICSSRRRETLFTSISWKTTGLGAGQNQGNGQKSRRVDKFIPKPFKAIWQSSKSPIKENAFTWPHLLA